MPRLFTLLALSLLFTNSEASAGEYRKLTLTDGRELMVDVRQTVMSGLQVTTPQGNATIPFELLVNMEPIGPNEYIEQENWMVYIYGPDEQRELAAKLFRAIPQTDVYGTPEAIGFLTDDQEMAMEGCAADTRCIAKLSKDLGTPWMWVVSLVQDENQNWVMRSAPSGSAWAESHVIEGNSPSEWHSASYEAIGLESPDKLSRSVEASIFGDVDSKKAKPSKPPKETASTAGIERQPRVLTETELQRLTFVPLPGMPALAQGDMGKFGIAMGAAIPLTAAWAGAVGGNAQSGAEFATITTLGFYALTVSINQALSKPSSGSARGRK